nr:VOC family protein [Frankia gtarii]
MTTSDSDKTARPGPSYGAFMPSTFNLTGLIVADMARSLAFYRLLGLDLPAGAETEPHVEVTLPGGLRLAFDTEETIRSFDPAWTPASGGVGRVSLAFACDSPAEVDAIHADLLAAGHTGHLSPWDAFWGQRYATVLDPDGNHVDLFAPLPAAPTP